MTAPALDYISHIPDAVPEGRVLVHNTVTAGITSRRRPGYRGFRSWFASSGDAVERCPCPWAPSLGAHYRVKLDQLGAAPESAPIIDRPAWVNVCGRSGCVITSDHVHGTGARGGAS